MDTLWSIARWFKLDKWLRAHRLHFGAGGAFVAVCICWWLTGSFYGGVISVALLIALWFVARFVGWVALRIKVTTEAGIPLDPWRMAKDLWGERAQFTEADDRWALAMRVWGVKYDGLSPNLRRKQLTADDGSFRGHVNLPAIGGNLDKIRHIVADGTLAGIMKCAEVSIREDGHGSAWLTFHKVAPSSRSLSLAELPVPRPGFISFGREDDGDAAEVEHGLSVLSIGETGSGKSKAMWNMFASMLRSGVPTEIDLFDPKGTELQVFKNLVGKKVGNILIRSYSRNLRQAEAVMVRFVAEMDDRADRLDERQLVEATEDMPARYIWADELNELNQLYAKPDSLMVTMVTKGRSSKEALMGSVQVGKVANLGHIRDVIPLNICMRTKTKLNTQAALATEADNTPPCHLIPRNTPGVGWYIKDGGEQRKFRTAHVTDKQLDDLAAGKLPKGTIMHAPVKYAGPPGFTYVGYDKQGRCMYVGKAAGFTQGLRTPVDRRRAQHRKYDRTWCVEHERVENWWRVHVVDTRLKVDPWPSEAAALVAEERLIKQLRPKFNIIHNGANPDSNANLAKRAGFRMRARDAGREWREFAREVRSLHQVKAGWRKQDRVAHQVEKRDRFVETVTR